VAVVADQAARPLGDGNRDYSMNLTGKDIITYATIGIVGYIAYRVFSLGENVGTAVNKFWTGLTFDTESIGPYVTLTPGAQLSQADYIARGYLEILPDGRTRITPAGEAYIRSQQAKVVSGEIIN
jgi:hypothetical protein